MPAGRRKLPTKHAATRADVMSFLQSQSVDRTADYARRGRLHRGLSDEELAATWKSALHRMGEDPWDEQTLKEYDDLSAEFELRAEAPPFESAHADFERFIDVVDEAVKRTKADPAKWKRANDKLQRDLNEHKARRDSRKH
jgi:hypothetical protein